MLQVLRRHKGRYGPPVFRQDNLIPLLHLANALSESGFGFSNRNATCQCPPPKLSHISHIDLIPDLRCSQPGRVHVQGDFVQAFKFNGLK